MATSRSSRSFCRVNGSPIFPLRFRGGAAAPLHRLGSGRGVGEPCAVVRTSRAPGRLAAGSCGAGTVLRLKDRRLPERDHLRSDRERIRQGRPGSSVGARLARPRARSACPVRHRSTVGGARCSSLRAAQGPAAAEGLSLARTSDPLLPQSSASSLRRRGRDPRHINVLRRRPAARRDDLPPGAGRRRGARDRHGIRAFNRRGGFDVLSSGGGALLGSRAFQRRAAARRSRPRGSPDPAWARTDVTSPTSSRSSRGDPLRGGGARRREEVGAHSPCRGGGTGSTGGESRLTLVRAQLSQTTRAEGFSGSGYAAREPACGAEPGGLE